MSDRIDDMVLFIWEVDAWPRLKRIRVQPSLYHDLLLRLVEDERPMILTEGGPQAFLMGVPVDCDPTLTNVAFEFDYA